jgi:hypothetical protein
MDGEPLMDPERISDVKKALEGFPGLAGVAVIEHDAGHDGECLIGYVVPAPLPPQRADNDGRHPQVTR